MPHGSGAWAPDSQAARDALIAAIMTFLGDQELLTRDEIRSALKHDIDRAGPLALVALRQRLAASGADWDFHPADPLARHIHHLLADRLLRDDSHLTGAGHASSLDGHPVVIVANHLSYADANVLEILLTRAGLSRLAGRLTAMAGPKVFTDRVRRFSSLCFGTIRTPQSANLSSGEAVMRARDVARAARRAIEVAHDRLSQGDVLLIFGEGTRSRTGAMQPMLGAIARYLELPGTRILPIGIVGSDALFPIGDHAIHPVRVAVHLGRPVDAATLKAAAGGDRRIVMDAIGVAVADLLPVALRGVYGDDTASPAARGALTAARSDTSR